MVKGREKRFLTYKEQEDYLNGKGISCYGREEQIMIRRLGYFNLVSGYKWPFVRERVEDGTYLYVKGTSVEQMERVKTFDDELRMVLLRYITKAEDEIRAIAAYKFDEVNLEFYGEVLPWTETRAYDFNRANKDIKRLAGRMERELSISRVNYLNEYRRKYDMVPTWLLFKFINFSTFIMVLDFAKPKVREGLCSLYGFITEEGKLNHQLLIIALHLVRMVRNVCAHNERVYDTNTPGRDVERYFKLLPNEYSWDLETKRLIDLFVYLKYFLDLNDYAGLIGQLKAMIKRLREELIPEAFGVILRDMGISDIDDLEELLREKHVAEYLDI